MWRHILVLFSSPAPLVTSSNVQKRNRAPKRHRYIFPHYWVSEDQLGPPPSIPSCLLALISMQGGLVSLSFRCKTMHYHSTKAARCSDYASYALSFCSVHILKNRPPDLGVSIENPSLFLIVVMMNHSFSNIHCKSLQE